MHPYSEGWVEAGKSNSTVLLNDFHSDHVAGTGGTLNSFSLFPRLPVELRLLIWKRFLQRHRLISITVVDKAHHSPYEDLPEQCNQRNSLGNRITGKNYKLQITTQPLQTPLLRVSSESRQAALDFYRVHVPFDRNSGEGHCYLNPEFDFIHIHPNGPSEVLAHFIHDFKAYDPKGVGILNLGIGTGRPRELDLPMDPAGLPSPVLAALKTTLANLQRVFFHHVVRWNARTMFDALDMAEVRHNRSFPITANVEAFDLVGTDPRPIEADLDKVALGWDPRSMPCLWQQMERNFEISRKPGTTEFVYHITAALFGGDSVVCSRADAVNLLQREHDGWRSGWGKGGFFEKHGYKDPDTPEKLINAPIPAFGFWVLPLDALGEVPKGEFKDITRWDMKMVANLEKHRPQLGVFRLPREG